MCLTTVCLTTVPVIALPGPKPSRRPRQGDEARLTRHGAPIAQIPWQVLLRRRVGRVDGKCRSRAPQDGVCSGFGGLLEML